MTDDVPGGGDLKSVTDGLVLGVGRLGVLSCGVVTVCRAAFEAPSESDQCCGGVLVRFPASSSSSSAFLFRCQPVVTGGLVTGFADCSLKHRRALTFHLMISSAHSSAPYGPAPYGPLRTTSGNFTDRLTHGKCSMTWNTYPRRRTDGVTGNLPNCHLQDQEARYDFLNNISTARTILATTIGL